MEKYKIEFGFFLCNVMSTSVLHLNTSSVCKLLTSNVLNKNEYTYSTRNFWYYGRFLGELIIVMAACILCNIL